MRKFLTIILGGVNGLSVQNLCTQKNNQWNGCCENSFIKF